MIFDSSWEGNLICIAPVGSSGEDENVSSMRFVNGGAEWFGTSFEARRYANDINTLRNKPPNSLDQHVSRFLFADVVVGRADLGHHIGLLFLVCHIIFEHSRHKKLGLLIHLPYQPYRLRPML